MPDNPDPTRRLRPLLETRVHRRTARPTAAPGEGADPDSRAVAGLPAAPLGADEDGPEEQMERAATDRHLQTAGGTWRQNRSDPASGGAPVPEDAVDHRIGRPGAGVQSPGGRHASGGWVPSWVDAKTEKEGPGQVQEVSAPPRLRRWTAERPTGSPGWDRRGSRPGGGRDPAGRRSTGRERWAAVDAVAGVDEVAERGEEAGQAERLSGEAEPVAPRGGRPGGWRPWARWRERWVPAGPGVRLDPGRRGGAVISMIAIGAVVASALGFFRNEGTVVAPSAVSVVDGGGPSSGSGSLPVLDSSGGRSADAVGPPEAEATAPASPPAAVDIIVAVTGAVRQPGVVTLAAGSRVADAIAAAGGVLDGTDYTGLNLAAKLADGDSVVVGGSGQGLRSTGGAPAPGAASAAATPELIDLNAADEAALETLPGVGPVMAGNILAWRDSNGGFRSVDQLQEITGIGPARYATLAPLVRVG